MRDLLKEGQLTREVPFLGGCVEVRKTTVRDLREIQEAAEGLDFEENSEESMEFVYNTLRRFVTGAGDMTDTEFEEFPLEDLAMLVEDILGKKAGNV